MVLQADCITDATIVIPNGLIHDGVGHKITAVDPPGGQFRGAVLQNEGSSASVINTVIETQGLADICNGGNNRLAGILFENASGSISGNTLLGVNKHPAAGVLSGCQEGNGIEVIAESARFQVKIDANTVVNYQKTGIVVNGSVEGIVTNNTVIGAGPQKFIGQNGIQIGMGASGEVRKNIVIGNAYTGDSTASGGIVVASGPRHESEYTSGLVIEANLLAGNDVGVWLMQTDAHGYAPPLHTGVKVLNNVITNSAVTNGFTYQAAVTVHGNGDEVRGNLISGRGYDPATRPGSIFAIDGTATPAHQHEGLQTSGN